MEDKSKKYVETIQMIRDTSEKMGRRFTEGSSQHTLMVHRARALMIAETCIVSPDDRSYSLEDLQSALPPLESIVSKSSKAQEKFKIWHGHYGRLQDMIEALQYAQSCMSREIERIAETGN